MELERHRAEARERLRSAGVIRPGPGSVAWKVNREIVVVGGWGRAVLLQLAHPQVAAAVDDHSSFRAGPAAGAGRLRSTVGAMLSLMFGDDEQAIGAAAGINAIHDRVFGRLPTGGSYSAHDPELLRWVHATLLESNLLMYERLVGPLEPWARERYCAEAAVMEPLLGIPAGLLPRSTAELDAYLGEVLASGRWAVTERSRALARAVLFPHGWQFAAPLMRPLQLMTIGLLPPAVRRAYGFAWSECDDRALARWTTVVRGARRKLPAALRVWPASREAAAYSPAPSG